MALSEFRWNKRRKHYAYLFKKIKMKRLNILISSRAFVIRKKTKIKQKYINNVRLFRHPNSNKLGTFYIIPIIYIDNISSFDSRVYSGWFFDKNDKRKIKRIKRKKKTGYEAR